MKKYKIGYDIGGKDVSCLVVGKGNKIIYHTQNKLIIKIVLRVARFFKKR